MQQQSQIMSLRCQNHVDSDVCSVQVSEQCSFPSRLACIRCIVDHKSDNNFIEFKDFISTDLVLANFKDCNSLVRGYLLDSKQQYIHQINQFFDNLKTHIEEFRQNLIKQLDLNGDYLQKCSKLRTQYDTELKNLKNKMLEIGQLDQYHRRSKWVELNKCVEEYVQLFYTTGNEEIKTTIQAFDSILPTTFDEQVIVDFRTSIMLTLDKVTKVLPFNNLFKICLDNSSFGNKILNKIMNGTIKQKKLLFDGQRDGMNATAFWQHCELKSSTLTICESQSGQIFGGYTPCQWNPNRAYQYDGQKKSFLFSVTKQQIYPLKDIDYVICGNRNFGPTFGGGADLHIKSDFQDGCSLLGHSYDISQYEVPNARTYLFGGDTPALKNIQVYQIE